MADIVKQDDNNVTVTMPSNEVNNNINNYNKIIATVKIIPNNDSHNKTNGSHIDKKYS